MNAHQAFTFRSTVLLLAGFAMLLAVGCTTSKTSQSYKSREAMTAPDMGLDIQQRIDQTPDNGIIRLPRGRYIINQPLRFDGRTNLSLIGEPGTQILLTDTDQNVIDIKNSKAIRIFNILARHLMPLSGYQCHGGVIGIADSKQITIANSELNGCGAVGVSVDGCEDLTIEHCYIHNNSFNALYLSNVQGLRLWSNVITANANTLQLYSVTDMQMSDNIIRDNTGYWRTPTHQPGLLEWTPKPAGDAPAVMEDTK